MYLIIVFKSPYTGKVINKVVSEKEAANLINKYLSQEGEDIFEVISIKTTDEDFCLKCGSTYTESGHCSCALNGVYF